MKVLKFGGTSVGSIESILKVKQIVESQKEPVIVVVSALGGITDQLIKVSNAAVAGGDSYLTILSDIISRHEQMIQAVIPAGEGQNRLMRQVKGLLDEMANILKGVALLQDLSPNPPARCPGQRWVWSRCTKAHRFGNYKPPPCPYGFPWPPMPPAGLLQTGSAW